VNIQVIAVENPLKMKLRNKKKKKNKKNYKRRNEDPCVRAAFKGLVRTLIGRISVPPEAAYHSLNDRFIRIQAAAANLPLPGIA
jgi:hypothetical protein